MSIVNVNFFSESLLRMVNFVAILPIDKRSVDGEHIREKGKPMKTLYLLHGIYGGEWNWITSTRIKKWAMDRNLAVIMPAGENSFYNNYEPLQACYGTYISKELVEFTRTMFCLSCEREDTFIAGASMGGMGALYSALRCPETFGYAGGFSTALIADMYPKSQNSTHALLGNRKYMEAVFGSEKNYKGSQSDYYKLAEDLKNKTETAPHIYMMCGSNDSLLNVNKKYYNHLLHCGINAEFHECQGEHDWAFWDKAVYQFLEWLPLECTVNERHR